MTIDRLYVQLSVNDSPVISLLGYDENFLLYNGTDTIIKSYYVGRMEWVKVRDLNGTELTTEILLGAPFLVVLHETRVIFRGHRAASSLTLNRILTATQACDQDELNLLQTVLEGFKEHTS